jgi:rhodanese-related sulfurtransferase
MEIVTPQEALSMVTSGQAYGIDVREQDEWDGGHYDQFTLHPLSAFDAKAIPTDKPVIFICRSGKRSAQACASVEPAGIVAINMDGGMLAWQEARLPMSAVNGAPLIS